MPEPEPSILNNRANQSKEAVNWLLKTITNGTLRPNQRLVETSIARELGMSRTPVREALKELEIKGYITQLETGGMVVADRTAQQIINLCEVREALETAGITLACQRRTENQLEKAASCQDRYRKAVDDGLIDESIRLNALFHDQLLAGCNNEPLLSILTTIRDRFLDRSVLRRFTKKQWRTVISQHENMLEAVRNRDSSTARKLVREHLRLFNKVASGVL